MFGTIYSSFLYSFCGSCVVFEFFGVYLDALVRAVYCFSEGL
jgi:hypothetical protein